MSEYSSTRVNQFGRIVFKPQYPSEPKSFAHHPLNGLEMCFRYSFSFIVFAAVLLLAAGIRAAPSDVVVEKAEEPAVAKPLTDASELTVPEDCHQPKETGRCFALFYRYAYNVDTQSCEEFVYGGCAGNKNNFESKEQCEQACLVKSAVSSTDSTTEQNSEVATETSTSS